MPETEPKRPHWLRIRQTLSLKLNLLLLSAMVVIFALMGYVNVRVHRQHLEQNTLLVAERISEDADLRKMLRAQKADFPNEDEPHLFDRVRKLAAPALSDGFAEIGTAVTKVTDPGDAERTLDTFYEITFSKSAPRFDDAPVELKFALGLEKRA